MFALRNNSKEFDLFKGGSKAAFRFLIRQYKSRLQQYIFVRIRDKALTQQYLLQTICEAWDYRACFICEAEFVLFLYHKVLCKSAGVEQDNEQQKIAEAGFLRWKDSIAGGEKEIAISKSDKDYMVRLAVEKLPAQRKRIIKSLFFEGMSSDQVAAAMDLSRQTVLNQKARAIAFLKLALHGLLL
jgi:RNA polymerase sigma factor (sigma-70 family)